MAKSRVTSVSRTARRKIIEAASRPGVAKAVAGATAARSQDFLYDEDGLPKGCGPTRSS